MHWFHPTLICRKALNESSFVQAGISCPGKQQKTSGPSGLLQMTRREGHRSLGSLSQGAVLWRRGSAIPPEENDPALELLICDCPECAIVCALRRATGCPLDDLTFVVSHFLPHLNRDAVYRILKAEGLGRLSPASRSRKLNGTFKDYDVGFVHVDVQHLPKLRTGDGESRKRYLYVAIDRASRFVHLAVKDDETERSAVAFLKEAVQAFPFQVTHVLTDRGSCFTAVKRHP